jgi:hypothetical protein
MTKTILAIAIAASATFGVGSIITADPADAHVKQKQSCKWVYGEKVCRWVKIRHSHYSSY